MIIDIKNHLVINRILLLTVGLWPYQQTRLVRLQVILIHGILMSGVIVLLTPFATKECTFKFVIKDLSLVLPFTTTVLTYNLFWLNTTNIKYLLDQLQHICTQLTDEHEISIIETYSCDAKRYTLNLILCVICCISIFLLLPICSIGINTLMKSEDYNSHILTFITTEYFVDSEKYFYLILLHVDVVSCTGLVSALGIGTLLMVYVKHLCGMFRIASYRIEQAMTIDLLKHANLESEIMIQKKIIFAVDIHRRAMELSTFLVSNFEEIFFFIAICIVVCLSLNLFRIFQIVFLESNMEELPVYLIITFIIVLCMFLPNYIGQEVKDLNNDVYETAYNVPWYKTPIRIQKLILFLLKRSNKVFSLSIRGLFTASLECFASLASASVSYFTVIFSTQQ